MVSLVVTWFQYLWHLWLEEQQPLSKLHLSDRLREIRRFWCLRVRCRCSLRHLCSMKSSSIVSIGYMKVLLIYMACRKKLWKSQCRRDQGSWSRMRWRSRIVNSNGNVWIWWMRMKSWGESWIKFEKEFFRRHQMTRRSLMSLLDLVCHRRQPGECCILKAPWRCL